MRTLIVYYSRTGNTRKVAHVLAGMLSADLAEIQCDRYPLGLFGFMRGGHDSMKGRLPAIQMPPVALQDYDLLVIGAPIWAGHPAPPIRAFLAGEKELPGRIGLFLTRIGSPPEKPLAELEAKLPAPAVARLALKSKDVRADAIPSALDGFAARLMREQAA